MSVCVHLHTLRLNRCEGGWVVQRGFQSICLLAAAHPMPSDIKWCMKIDRPKGSILDYRIREIKKARGGRKRKEVVAHRRNHKWL